jgi:hypothetical protein
LRESHVSNSPATRDFLPPHVDERDDVDPELLELPDPPKRERTATVALLLFTALASIAMVFALRRDAAYSFASPDAVELGELSRAPSATFVPNAYVHGSALLGAAHAIRYERPLVSDSFRLMPVAGRQDVWVEVRVPDGAENVRWVPPTEFSGRLVHFDGAGPRHRGLASAIHDVTGREVPQGSWLLVDGDPPGDARWAVMLCFLFAGFAVWNLLVSAKLLRPVK